MQSTGDRILDIIEVRRTSSGRYRGNNPLRAGSDSDGFVLTIDGDGEHGTYYDHAREESGSLYELADLLGIERPKSNGSNPSTKRSYTTLGDYAHAHYVMSNIFVRAGWRETTYQGRPALEIPTKTGKRYRFLDGQKPFYKHPQGYKPCWYGLGRMARIATRQNMPMILCNGEASTVVAQSYRLSACAITSGSERSKLPDHLLAELQAAYQGPIIIAFDCDNAGREKAPKMVAFLRQHGYQALAVDLGGKHGFDLADFCGQHKEQAKTEIYRCSTIIKGIDDVLDLIAMTAAQDLQEVLEGHKSQLIKLSKRKQEQINALLYERKLTKTWVKGFWQSVRAEIKQKKEEALAALENKTISPSSSSWPYEIENNCINFLTHKVNRYGEIEINTKRVCDFCAEITEEITTESNEQTRTLLVTNRVGQQKKLEISVEHYADDRQLKAALLKAAGAKYPVRARMGYHLAPAISLLTQGDPYQAIRYERTGWLKDHFLIQGKLNQNEEISLPEKLAYDLSGGDLQQGLIGLDALIFAQEPVNTMPALMAFLQAPLAKLADWRNDRYATFIQGRSGTFKTAWASLAMCLYGAGFSYKENLLKWGEGATTNALMHYATYAHDLPLLIDNYKPSTGGGEKAFKALIQNIIEGAEKDRLSRSAKLKEARKIFTWPICTGEDTPTSDGATVARMLLIKFDWPRGQTNSSLSQAQSLAKHLPAIGKSWLDWLLTPQGQHWSEWAKHEFDAKRTHWAAVLNQRRSNITNPLRIASSLAGNELTFLVASQHPDLSVILSQFKTEFYNGLDAIANTMAEAAAESLEASRFLDALREMLTGGQAILLGMRMKEPLLGSDKSKVVGWADSQTAYLIPSVARQIVERFRGKDYLGNVSSRTLHEQLLSIEALTKRAKDKITCKKEVYQGFRPRLLWVHRKLLVEDYVYQAKSQEKEEEDF
jgi:hypothetical protein